MQVDYWTAVFGPMGVDAVVRGAAEAGQSVEAYVVASAAEAITQGLECDAEVATADIMRQIRQVPFVEIHEDNAGTLYLRRQDGYVRYGVEAVDGGEFARDALALALGDDGDWDLPDFDDADRRVPEHPECHLIARWTAEDGVEIMGHPGHAGTEYIGREAVAKTARYR